MATNWQAIYPNCASAPERIWRARRLDCPCHICLSYRNPAGLLTKRDGSPCSMVGVGGLEVEPVAPGHVSFGDVLRSMGISATGRAAPALVRTGIDFGGR